MDKDAEVARNPDASCLDLLRVEEPYKLPWLDRLVLEHRMILGWHCIVWAPYVAYPAMHSKAKTYVQAEDGLQWVKTGADRCRYLRPKLTQYHTNLADRSESD
jgi:hypothetical protein